MGAGSGMSSKSSRRIPLTPREGWLSDGRQVLRFRPTRWERDYHRIELVSGELLPGSPIPLLKRRKEISREDAVKVWREKCKAGLD
jgi:hypothetical protein